MRNSGGGGRPEHAGDQEQREEEAGGWGGRRVQVFEVGEESAAETDEEIQVAGKLQLLRHHRQV